MTGRPTQRELVDALKEAKKVSPFPRATYRLVNIKTQKAEETEYPDLEALVVELARKMGWQTERSAL